MYKILQATYHNGHLILDTPSPSFREGQLVQIVVLDTDVTQSKKEQFFAAVNKHAFTLPQDYTFDREALYER